MLWSDDYRVGVPELDGQHMIIFSILGQVEAAMAAGVSAEVARDILRGLRDFVAFHLRHEEVLMERKGYGAAYGHTHEHRHIIENLDVLLESDDLVAALGAAYRTVREWFAEHILTEDYQFAAFLKAKEA